MIPSLPQAGLTESRSASRCAVSGSRPRCSRRSVLTAGCRGVVVRRVHRACGRLQTPGIRCDCGYCAGYLRERGCLRGAGRRFSETVRGGFRGQGYEFRGRRYAVVGRGVRFYALTPALPFADDHRSVSVGHGTDYACSLTAACQGSAVGASSQTVALSMLERKCSRLHFHHLPEGRERHESRYQEGGAFRNHPFACFGCLCEALPTDVGGGTYDFPASTFTQGDQPYGVPRSRTRCAQGRRSFRVGHAGCLQQRYQRPPIWMLRFPLWRLLLVFVSTFDVSLQGASFC